LGYRELAGLFIAIYFILGSLIAWWSRRKYTGKLEEFYTASGRFGWLASSFTYAATTYSAFMIVGLVGISYSTGIGSLGFELTYLTSTIFLLGLFAIRVWRLSRKYRWQTPSQMLGWLYSSKKLQLVVSLLYLIALSPYMAAQLQGIASAIEGLGFGYGTGVFLAFVVALLWTLSAGMWSIVYTDLFQGVWMILASVFLLAWVSAKISLTTGFSQAMRILGENGFLSVGHGFWPLPVFVGYTIPWIFFSVTNPQVVHRLYLPKTGKDVRKMVISFSIYGLLYTIIMVLIGLLSRVLSIEGFIPNIVNRDLVTPTLLSYANPILSAFVFTSIIAASISTTDSILHTVSTSFSSSISAVKLIGTRREKLLAYITVFLVLFAVTLISFYRLAFIVELSVISSLLLLPLAPPTIYSWLIGRSVKRKGILIASLSIGLGAETAAILYIILSGEPLKKLLITTLAGVPLPLWILILSTLSIIPFIYKK
jgi:SSS family solute:Na+ symporter